MRPQYTGPQYTTLTIMIVGCLRLANIHIRTLYLCLYPCCQYSLFNFPQLKQRIISFIIAAVTSTQVADAYAVYRGLVRNHVMLHFTNIILPAYSLPFFFFFFYFFGSTVLLLESRIISTLKSNFRKEVIAP